MTELKQQPDFEREVRNAQEWIEDIQCRLGSSHREL